MEKQPKTSPTAFKQLESISWSWISHLVAFLHKGQLRAATRSLPAFMTVFVTPIAPISDGPKVKWDFAGGLEAWPLR